VRTAATKAADLATGQPVTSTRSGDALRFATQIRGSDVWVLRLSRP
jgi:hypothetical protein